MRCTIRAAGRQAGPLLLLILLSGPLATPVFSSDRVAPTNRNPLIQRALDWLTVKPRVPIEVVDPRRLPASVAQTVRRACGFVQAGVPRIYILSTCRVYQRADHNPLDAIALAAVIGHELAHLEGSNESEARRVEVELVRTMAAGLPGEYRVRTALYIADLHRRTPVSCETHPTAGAFHPCGQAGNAGIERVQVRAEGSSGKR